MKEFILAVGLSFLVTTVFSQSHYGVVKESYVPVYKNIKTGEKMGVMMVKDSFLILDRISSHYQILYKGDTGYAFNYYFIVNPELEKTLENKYHRKDSLLTLKFQKRRDSITAIEAEKKGQQYLEIEKEKKLLKQKDLERKNTLLKKYGQVEGNKIYKGEIWIGMSKEKLLASWGSPSRINKTITARGTREQWIYYDDYVYLENDSIMSIQTSE